jgi:hypothetical protein
LVFGVILTSVETKTIAPRKRVAKGPKRPQYLQNPELDKFMMMFTALLADVSAIRDRLDTHERLAKLGKVATPEEVEAFKVDADVQADREKQRDAMLNRVFRILLEELEAARDSLSTKLLDEVLEEDASKPAA